MENEQIMSEGAEVQEVADPVETDIDIQPEPGESDSAEQSAETNSRMAAARRKAENEKNKAIADLKAEHAREKAELEANFIKSLGLSDPDTGKPIISRDEYNAYRQKQIVQSNKEYATRLGVTEEEFSSIIENHPAVRQARIAEEQAKAAQLETEKLEKKKNLEKELSIISAMDSSITNPEQLMAHESYPAVKKYVTENKLTLSEAYRLANIERLTNAQLSNAKQSALNSIDSKSHLVSTPTGASGNPTVVPDAVKAQYRMMMPGISDADIAKNYSEYLKSKK